MKYLVHAKPPKEISDCIAMYRAEFATYVTKISKNDSHTTLMAIQVMPSNEKKVVTALDELDWNEFETESENLDLFDETSLVIRLKKTNDLMGFHRMIIEALKGYIHWDETPKFDGDESKRKTYEVYGSPFYADFYNPHITVAHVNPEILRDKNFDRNYFKGRGWRVFEFYLSRREADSWKTVRKFSH